MSLILAMIQKLSALPSRVRGWLRECAVNPWGREADSTFHFRTSPQIILRKRYGAHVLELAGHEGLATVLLFAVSLYGTVRLAYAPSGPDCSHGPEVVGKLEDGSPIYMPTCGISPPRIVYQEEPEYSDKAPKKENPGHRGTLSSSRHGRQCS